MFADIRSRLLVSYIVIILTTLLITLLTLAIFIRPLQSQMTQVKLAQELIRFRRPLLQTLNQHTFSRERHPRSQASFPWEPPDLWEKRAYPVATKLLGLNQEEKIVFDSTGQWTGQQFRLNNTAQINQTLFQGQRRGPDHRRYVYVGSSINLNDVGHQPSYIILLAPQSRLAESFINELSNGFLIAGLIAFALSMLLSFWITRSIANPLRVIAQGAKAVAQGNYEHQVTEKGPYEVKQVARSFNDMMTQVQASQTATRDFMINASHDLKTPLTSIQGFSQALLDGAAQDEQTRLRAATIIHTEAQRMHRLVDNLLDLLRLNAGQITLNQDPLDLVTLLEATLDSLAPQIAEKQLHLSQHFIALPCMMGDGDRLRQVFTNLLDNAIKYTPAEGHIQLEGTWEVGSPVETMTSSDITRSNDGVKSFAASSDLSDLIPDAEFSAKAISSPNRHPFIRVTVSNTGPGIPPEDLNRVFERFYRVDKSRKNNHGSGLGLTIVHDIVKAHQGYLRAQSIPEQWTQFTVWLPGVERAISSVKIYKK